VPSALEKLIERQAQVSISGAQAHGQRAREVAQQFRREHGMLEVNLVETLTRELAAAHLIIGDNVGRARAPLE